MDYIINIETDKKTSNYCGRIRYFTCSNAPELEHEQRGFLIKEIDSLREFSENALVIVATQEKYHKGIRDKLHQLGFYNVMCIDHALYILMKERVDNYNGIYKQQVMQYSIMHQFQLQRIREKTRNGKKVKVFFMTQRPAAFGCASVYRAMEKNKLFEPFIFVISKRDLWYKDFYNVVQDDVKWFENHGFRAISAYDECQNPRDLHMLEPDIIFYDSPNLYGPSNNSYWRLDLINWNYLTCYVPYGLMMVNSFFYHYENINVQNSWLHFIDTSENYKRCLAEAQFNGGNMVLSGYPKFDDYMSVTDHGFLKKIKNNKKNIIYAPHWSLRRENNFATFDLYMNFFMDMLKKHDEFNFVFKPHPELEFRIKALHAQGKIDISEDDYKNYMNLWNNAPNGICITEGDYIEIFQQCDCMITDCGSFIGEWLPTLKPCIYLFNPRKKNQLESYTAAAKKILGSYYVCNDENELIATFNDVVLNSNDYKEELRRKILKDTFPNIGNSGKFICDYIERQLQ